ncbi:glycosyltransferase family 2 protein [Brachybacterium alimentarium]|uniref:glycosyltransferase family 2 protein n=2 Tax=Brachybacterium alimentarium TaxID=47845 RepID=UPI000DF135C7|nr:glycosyltransferase family 2 protein [Brachybacterium alimentarium]RCS64801.1 glycosyltransferase family 2 protein [Brachybacterium alimentarium]
MESPDVSVIIPVYNAVDYVGQAVGSVQAQSISAERVEIVIVDDGSTDGSGEVVRELAAADSRIRVISQVNSGTPGGARNPAIGAASGKFVFFLDADDRLSDLALERMVDTAIAEGSEVVLGKIASVDGRRVPTSMFRESVLDADIVRNKIFNTLGPTKLVSKTLIDRLDLRFPTDQKVGEDQPFMAAAYLNASKISILADMDYYLIQHRSDRGNITFTKQDSFAHAEVAVRLSRVIERYTEPGEVRDALIRRPFDWSLPRAMDSRWNSLTRGQQEKLADYIRTSVGHLYTEGARALLRPESRVRTDLMMSGDLDALAHYIQFIGSSEAKKIEWRADAFRTVVPSGLSGAVPIESLEASAPKISCRLESVAVKAMNVSVAASVAAPTFVGAPDMLSLRARHRVSGEIVDARVTYEERKVGTENFLVAGDFELLGRGVWDVYVCVIIGTFEKLVRLGSSRLATIPPEGVSNQSETSVPESRVFAYFTQGAGNLAVDVGSVLHKNVARAAVIGLTVDENACPVAIVNLTRPPRVGDEYFAYLDNVPSYGARMLLPAERLGSRVVGLRLPLTAEMQGVTLTASAVLGGEPVELTLGGSEFWSARLAGFGLADSDGGLKVTEPPLDSVVRADFQQAVAPSIARIKSSMTASRKSVKSLVGAVPVIGPLARRMSKRIRSGS